MFLRNVPVVMVTGKEQKRKFYERIPSVMVEELVNTLVVKYEDIYYIMKNKHEHYPFNIDFDIIKLSALTKVEKEEGLKGFHTLAFKKNVLKDSKNIIIDLSR
jgi:hypothetical protein